MGQIEYSIYMYVGAFILYAATHFGFVIIYASLRGEIKVPFHVSIKLMNRTAWALQV